MDRSGNAGVLPFPRWSLPRLWGRKRERAERRERPPALVSPLEAQQARRAADMQRMIGVGRWPGMSHEEFESVLLRRIQQPF